MSDSNAAAGPSNARPLTTNSVEPAETLRAFATLTNGAPLDPDDEDQDDSMDWEEVDILGTGLPEIQPITEVEVTLGEKQQVKRLRK
jgi:hypothetical protein